MPALTGPALVAAALLAFAGGQKLLDPTMTVGALRALGLPGSSRLVRLGSAAELALGVLAVVVGGPVLWGLVAASYLAFAAFVMAALRAGTMIGSCGCFGREDTPPHPIHVALDLALVVIAVAVAVDRSDAPIDALAAHPTDAAFLVLLGIVAAVELYAAFVLLPRALVRREGG